MPTSTDVSCDDALACTIDDHCRDGRCEGDARVCSDALACSVDRCDEDAGGCVSDTSACECEEDAECDDHNACDGVETCKDGHCAEGTAVVCTTPDEQCLARNCQPATGTCKLEAKPATAFCDDDDACTVDDHCGGGGQAGTCVHDSVVACVAADDCHEAGVCNPLSGVCTTPTQDDDTQCHDAVGWEDEPGARGLCESGACRRLPLLALGLRHSCALFADGALRCWGVGGAVGYGSPSNVGDSPQRAVKSVGYVPAPAMTWVAAGANFTCGVSSDGVRCWGEADHGLGYVGVGLLGYTPETVPSRLEPIDLGKFPDGTIALATRVSGSTDHVCVLTQRGSVRCWGYEDNGGAWGYPGIPEVQLAPANPTMDDVGDMVVSTPDETFDVADIRVGERSQCVRSLQGTFRCWGDRGFIAVHIDAANERVGDDELPATAPLALGASAISAISLSAGHGCVISRLFGSLFCWGGNLEHQVGSGGATTVESAVPVGGDVVYESVACGGQHTCTVDDIGGVRCWGSNQRGQLGNGSTESVVDSSDAILVQLPEPAATVSAGAFHTCAVLRDGRIACWGANDLGQLGIDSTEDFGDEPDELTPQPIQFE